jgi:hypothetical protein
MLVAELKVLNAHNAAQEKRMRKREATAELRRRNKYAFRHYGDPIWQARNAQLEIEAGP